MKSEGASRVMFSATDIPSTNICHRPIFATGRADCSGTRAAEALTRRLRIEQVGRCGQAQPSAANPKFAQFCGELGCELRVQKRHYRDGVASVLIDSEVRTSAPQN